MGGISYTYDHDGNSLSKLNSTGLISYNWDSRNRLKSIITKNKHVKLIYNFENRLIRKIISDFNLGISYTQNFIIDDFDNIVSFSDSFGKAISVLTGNSLDSHIATIYSNNNVYFPLKDLINSTIIIVDEHGGIIENKYYEPFGETTHLNNIPYLFQYTGRLPIIDNIYYFRARFYDSKIGRFLSRDPAKLQGDNINLYAYAFNNPILYNDPTGYGGAFIVGVCAYGGAFGGPLGCAGAVTVFTIGIIVTLNKIRPAANDACYNPPPPPRGKCDLIRNFYSLDLPEDNSFIGGSFRFINCHYKCKSGRIVPRKFTASRSNPNPTNECPKYIPEP